MFPGRGGRVTGDQPSLCAGQRIGHRATLVSIYGAGPIFLEIEKARFQRHASYRFLDRTCAQERNLERHLKKERLRRVVRS